ncbi:hemerythrin [Caballeronia megalochromosomata]|nr:hemerythrin [Caballeronia megalochromosomata]
MNAITAFNWDDRYLVGHGLIDDTHREFVEILNTMIDADPAAIPATMEALARHVEAHFALEERLMEQYAFPARECHVEEHEKVLASVREVRALVATGATEVAVELAHALVDWFPGHSDYMDSALAAWVVKKTAGGAPLVLRRFKPALQASNH